MSQKRLLVALVIIVIVGVGIFFFQNGKLTPSKDYKNISYQIEGESVLLQGGLAEKESAPGSASKTITRYFGNDVRGDFNNDKREDIAFLLTQSSGGSGTFYYVVVALGKDKGYSGTNALFIGDRIAPQTTEFRDGEIIVNYADRKPSDAMTETPSVGISRYFAIQSNTLVEIKK